METTNDLTDKRARFIEEYLLCLNGTKAALRAGYAPSGARQEASRLLSNADIRGQIDERLKQVAMSADEAVKRVSDIASTRLNDFFVIRQVQGYEQEEHYLSVLVERKREEIGFIQEFAQQENIPLFDVEGAPTNTGLRLFKAKEELLELTIKLRAHGPDAVMLAPGKPTVYEVADLDIVALSRADAQGLLKSFKHTKEGISVETCAPDAALRDILKLHGRFVERTDITSGGKAITATVEIIASGPPLASNEKEIHDAL